MNFLKYFDHPNVIKLFHILDTVQDLYIVTEYISGGDLFNLINDKGCLSEQEAMRFFWQLMEGLEYIHSCLISHRDLKLENILIDKNNNLKIADFGLSNYMKDGQFLKTGCGSLHYAAPEIHQGIEYTGV
jgi:5'-AMP-activated protein kinase catalytic alpha subunit